MLCLLTLCLAADAAQAAQVHFRLEEKIGLPAAFASAKSAKLWVPMPSEGEGQILHSFEASPGCRMFRDPLTGNRFLYWERGENRPMEASLWIRFEVWRSSHAVDEKARRLWMPPPEAFAPWMKPDAKAPKGDKVKALSDEIVKGATSDWEKGKRLYAHVFDHMTYDKKEPGWGDADVARAIAVCKGNCTDFHGLFIALCLSQGIPARLQMGLSLPPGSGTEPKPGYHCWAEFHAKEQGWVPVDISAARQKVGADLKAATDADRWGGFATLDQFRVGFGRGLDAPLPNGGSQVRFALDPVLELDGKRVPVGKADAGAVVRTWRLEWLKE